MLTDAQLRIEFYNAVANDSILQSYVGNPPRIQALGNITTKSKFPLIVFYRANLEGNFAFQTDLQSESVTFETRTYTDTQDASLDGYKSDLISQRLKQVLNSIGYMHTDTSTELLDPEINKHVTIIRWERVNV